MLINKAKYDKMVKRIETLEEDLNLQKAANENLFNMIQQVNNHVELLDNELHPKTFQGGN